MLDAMRFRFTSLRPNGRRPREPRRRRLALAALALLSALPGAFVAPASAANLAPIEAAGEGQATSAWQPVGLPQQSLPRTRYTSVALDGLPALRLSAEGSYGHLLHAWPAGQPLGRLQWQWRLDQPNPAADLRQKAGDDSPVKVCVLFDAPLDSVPFVERQLLRLARARSGQDLPAATLCYVWDSRLPAGSVLDNAYTRRMRLIVLRGPDSPTGQWLSESVDVAADAQRLFGSEWRQLPPVQAVLVGADADNTRGRSLAHVRALRD